MSSSPDTGHTWAAVGPKALAQVLVPLRDEHHLHGALAMTMEADGALENIARQLHGRATLLVVEDPANPSLRSRYASAFLTGAEGQDVVLGWLRLDERELAAYARRAVALLRRPEAPVQPLVMLGPRELRYADLLDEIERVACDCSAVQPFRWSAERLARWALLKALRHGVGAVLYTGHGNADGWFAYGGLSSRALVDGDEWGHDESSGVMLSLACRTAQPSPQGPWASSDQGRGFADRMIGHGITGVVLAPVGDAMHTDNRTLAAMLVRKLSDGHRSCRDLVEAVRREGASLDGYAIVGDPAIRVTASAGATTRCRSVFAPAPGVDLESALLVHRFRDPV